MTYYHTHSSFIKIRNNNRNTITFEQKRKFFYCPPLRPKSSLITRKMMYYIINKLQSYYSSPRIWLRHHPSVNVELFSLDNLPLWPTGYVLIAVYKVLIRTNEKWEWNTQGTQHHVYDLSLRRSYKEIISTWLNVSVSEQSFIHLFIVYTFWHLYCVESSLSKYAIIISFYY